VGERRQLHLREHVAQAAHAGPRLDVGGRGGAERAEVAADQRLEVGFGARLRRERERRVRRIGPAVVARNHHERQVEPGGVAERALVDAGEGLDEERPELVERPRFLLDQLARDRDQRIDVESRVAVPEGRHRRGQGGLERCAEGGVVARAQQVQRRPHGGRADDAPVVDRLVELLAAEVVQARPQCEKRWLRLLRLQAAELLDGACHVGGLALEEHLARERRAVELPQGERVHGVHGGAGAAHCGH